MSQFPISPLDGRYARQISDLAPEVSEFGLMKYRLEVMSRWVIFLTRHGIANHGVEVEETLNNTINKYDDTSYARIKAIEKITNHDVKAVEYFMREALPESVWPWIHFACTSEDVNNVAYALIQEKAGAICEKELLAILSTISTMAKEWASIPMLSRTHGQAATPTTVGKEIAVFRHRINVVHERIEIFRLTAKWNGATGNYAAHHIAFAEVDWQLKSRQFIESFNFEWNPLTTQIESHDTMAAMLNNIGQLCTIMVDLCSDIWGYVSLDYFGLKVIETETGSSTMPGKVNPIDFENARGNFKMARGLGRILSEELPISTWQRDLTDSTLQRNLGSVYGYYLVGLKSLHRGLKKLVVRPDVLFADLERHPEVLGEAIQTMLRKHGKTDAYEQLKNLLRGNKVSLQKIRKFIKTLDVPQDDKNRLLGLEPAGYVGYSSLLV